MAKWIYTNYSTEEAGTIQSVLSNPPGDTGDKNWRLTPDTIKKWFTLRLEWEAQKRENEYLREKHKVIEKEPTVCPPEIAEGFKQMIAAIPDPVKRPKLDLKEEFIIKGYKIFAKDEAEAIRIYYEAFPDSHQTPS